MVQPPGIINEGKKGRGDLFPVVGIGASAGGLEAFRQFLDAMPANNGMAFILVQHLDPSHESLIAELLSDNTKMKVYQAVDGKPVERNCVYVIPPGVSLAIINGLLHLSATVDGHGLRLPFDFLLQSLAEQFGERAVGVILSGTGSDGTCGIKAVKKCGGLIIAQDPVEATYDGMPQSAIDTSLVDRVLSVNEIPAVLLRYGLWIQEQPTEPGDNNDPDLGSDQITEIIELLRSNSIYDFTRYKRGTLERRAKRRLAMSKVADGDFDQYLEFLRNNPDEVVALAKDLLINVTDFFRDPEVFEMLANKVVPELVARAEPGTPLRIWVIGCSSGEEVYSLLIIFLEQIAKSKRPIKVQFFASDIDPDAIDTARQGFYPHTIAEDVSAERLSKFFRAEGSGYRVSPKLRDSVIFTVQDILTDPPFSHIDMISCRNLLIYLLPDAQTKVFSLIGFSLNDNGILLLGASESPGKRADKFSPVFNKERIYRQINKATKPVPEFSAMTNRQPDNTSRRDIAQIPSRQTFLADFCRRLILDALAPASVLINENQECVFTVGETAQYLRIAPGHPTNDILTTAREDVRSHLREAISRGALASEKIEVDGGFIIRNDKKIWFCMAVQPVRYEGERLLLISFFETQIAKTPEAKPLSGHEASRVAELERELEAKKTELATAQYNIEFFTETQATISAEALSVSEEFQATNEELLTSKEELQSLNEELAAINTQLQETLEQQQRTSNDLQNVLFSTDVATIFLDTSLNIRFFTPAARSVFNIIEGDIGRPLSDLSPLSADAELLDKADLVLKDKTFREKEIKGTGGKWFNRRILPYRTSEGETDGVVITYQDISHQKAAAEALDAARHLAVISNATKAGFFSAASHDLRQPLQTLILLQSLLEPMISNVKAKNVAARMGTILNSFSRMLNSMLDINRIDTGTISLDKGTFQIEKLLKQLGEEFKYHAEAKGLELRVVHCRCEIFSDQALLEQILRNLLANAIKFTRKGKVLLGCRRKGENLQIQIWDTGVGIARGELRTIFDEYRQLNAAPADPDRGLGLGLAIVKRLTNLLGHRIDVASYPGKATVFTINVQLKNEIADRQPPVPEQNEFISEPEMPTGSYDIIVIEDEPDVLELLELSLDEAGHNVKTGRNEAAVNQILETTAYAPDIIIADYNLMGSINGLHLALKIREKLDRNVPIIILTGDTTRSTVKRVAQEGCLYIHKPVTSIDLQNAIHRLVGEAAAWPDTTKPQRTDTAVISVIDDDAILLDKLRHALEMNGAIVKAYGSSEEFLEDNIPGGKQCLILDAYLPGLSGLRLMQHLRENNISLPTIVITGMSDTQTAVDVMKAGAINFMEKPIDIEELRANVTQGLEISGNKALRERYLQDVGRQYASLTERQVEIMERVIAGQPSKIIADDLGISQRTVENHRATIMTKTQSKSLPALARFGSAVDELKDL